MLPKHILTAIREQVGAEAPAESCGLVVRIGVRRLKYFPCKNVFTDQEGQLTTADGFAISDLDWMRAEDEGEIVRVIHSHPGQGDNPIPSLHDIQRCNASGVIWGIMTDTGAYVEIEPEEAPLTGRRFVLGVTDCYGLVMDWHKRHGVTLRDFRVPYHWWERGENLYMDNWKGAGFVECEPDTPGAMVIMQVAADVANHAGIYLPDGRLLHHLYGHLSNTIPFRAGYYRDNVVKWVRHKDLPQDLNYGNDDL